MQPFVITNCGEEEVIKVETTDHEEGVVIWVDEDGRKASVCLVTDEINQLIGWLVDWLEEYAVRRETAVQQEVLQYRQWTKK